ncbi:ABC transporter permease [Paenibacillaceae bacterium WGS1546]|uniref:ABC transporter permease n=1 Tax=Cohnella sp. WGS1546 TaxID=3366810 RepID=UPI00372D39FB
MQSSYFRVLWKDMVKDKWLYLFLAPSIVLVFVFSYVPLYGIVLAFKNYNGLTSIMDSKWVGLKYFELILKDPLIPRAFMNTVKLGVLSLLFCFPAPIVLALIFNELKQGKFKKFAQSVSYLPYFISTVIIVGMMKEILAIDGVVNHFLRSIGLQAVNFMSDASSFRTIYISSEIWTGIGWGSILYLAAISSIPDEMYEAATIDGANRLQKIRHITFPALLPVISIQFILSVGLLLGASFEKIILMYSPATYETADILATYVYRNGLQNANYSYGVAVGLVNSVLSFLLVFFANKVMRRLTGYSFW